MIDKKNGLIEFRWALAALCVVYLLGFGIPLMENDAAQFAVMAMRIAQTNDYLHLYKGIEAYLDKPHLHYWLAAISFEIFGIKDWAYRLPGLLFIVLAAFSTFRLSLMLTNRTVAEIATLFFLSSQAVLLMGHDMRTDAVLTGCTVFALWQFVAFFERNNWHNLFLGAIGLAAAFSCKGLLGVVIGLMCLLGYIIASSKWKQLLNWKVWILGLSIFFLASIPVFYALYVQFGTDGILFLMIGQSFERMSGGTWDTANPEYLFFWHTILWACLPYALLLYAYWVNKLVDLRKKGINSISSADGLVFVGLLTTLIIISFSKFKLPHYLNSMMPMFAIASAVYTVGLTSKKAKKISEFAQLFIFFIAVMIALLISFWVFRESGLLFGLFTILSATAILVYLYGQSRSYLSRITVLSIGAMLIANVVLNAHFYPKLLEFQTGQTIADYLNKNEIDPNTVFDLNPENWSLEFYTRQWKPDLSQGELNKKINNVNQEFYVVARAKNSNKIMADCSHCKIIKRFDDFGVTRLSIDFLNPKTRSSKLNRTDLIKVSRQ